MEITPPQPLPRRCVYTVLLGEYEQLNEQTVAKHSAIPFICLTDAPGLTSKTWQIRLVTPVFGMDPIRSQRNLKLRPHLYLPDFDESLYIDNSVLLTQKPEDIFARHFPASGIGVPAHSYRASTLDEFLEVARLGFDDQHRVFEQLNHYTLDCPEVLAEPPYWTAILLRDHKNQDVQRMAEIWLAHIYRYSRRDQLSVRAAFHQAGLTPDVLEIDNHHSWFHTWPHMAGRDRNKGARNPAAALMPLTARLRQMEQALAEKDAALAEQIRINSAMAVPQKSGIAAIWGKCLLRARKLLR
jgi:hypothetical protein